jgi:hypothetical protein
MHLGVAAVERLLVRGQPLAAIETFMRRVVDPAAPDALADAILRPPAGLRDAVLRAAATLFGRPVAARGAVWARFPRLGVTSGGLWLDGRTAIVIHADRPGMGALAVVMDPPGDLRVTGFRHHRGDRRAREGA